jgi:K+-sensing histidine kinase KdpD
MQLKKDNKIRSLLVGGISHDLRTPLNGIMILLNEVVKNCKKIPKTLIEKYIIPSLNNCNHLMNLINDILDFT